MFVCAIVANNAAPGYPGLRPRAGDGKKTPAGVRAGSPRQGKIWGREQRPQHKNDGWRLPDPIRWALLAATKAPAALMPLGFSASRATRASGPVRYLPPNASQAGTLWHTQGGAKWDSNGLWRANPLLWLGKRQVQYRQKHQPERAGKGRLFSFEGSPGAEASGAGAAREGLHRGPQASSPGASSREASSSHPPRWRLQARLRHTSLPQLPP